MKKQCIYILMAVFLIAGHFSAHGQELEQIKKNYLSILIPQTDQNDTLMAELIKNPREEIVSDQMVQELMNRYPFDLKNIESYLHRIQSDGSFSDINYQDNRRSGWDPKNHAERILELCKLYTSPTTQYYHSKTIADTIHNLMNFWFTQKPRCLNWWQNEIGIPRTLGQAFIIFEKDMTPDEIEGTLEVMSHVKFGRTGQNKVWQASNILIRGLLQNDEELVKAARDTIFSEIRTNGAEGIRPDWSYQLHGPQLQFGNYGMAFLSGMTFFYRLFKGTSYQMSAEQQKLLTDLINKGFRWTIWNRQMDINALGRQLFHNGALHKGYCLAFAAQDMDISGVPLHGNAFIGHKHFPYSDYTVHRTKDWMASLRMSSLRTVGSETVNEDNMHGKYLGDGALYIYTDDNGYMDAFPYFDWRKIPGITAFESSEPVMKSKEHNNSQQVDGLGDGLFGMSAMNYNRDGLQARKSWIFTSDMVICLGSGISSDSTLEVTTCIDQRLSNGALKSLNRKSLETTTKGVRKPFDNSFIHDSIGYVPLQKGMIIQAENTMKTGKWSDNMKMYPDEIVRDSLMTLAICHGTAPQNATYAYAVIPRTTEKSLAGFKNKDIEIVSNTTAQQVAGGKALNNKYWAVIYSPSRIKIHGTGLDINVPSIYLLEMKDKNLIIIKKQIFNN